VNARNPIVGPYDRSVDLGCNDVDLNVGKSVPDCVDEWRGDNPIAYPIVTQK